MRRSQAVMRLHLGGAQSRGYTLGVRTTVSLPNDLFVHADQLAGLLGKSRSQLYAEAIREYVSRHRSDAMIEAINRTIDDSDRDLEQAVPAASAEILARV